MDELRMLRIGDVERKTGAKKTSIYDAIRAGEFPPPVKPAMKMSVWPSTEVDVVLRARIAGVTNAEVKDIVRGLVAQRSKAVGADGSS